MELKKLIKHTPLIAAVILSIAVPLVSSAILKDRPINLQQSDNTQLEIELITLRPAGFEPSEITRPKGAFVLFLDDRSGKENSSLVLQRVNGERLRTINVERKKSNWNEVFNLAPGTYILQDGSNSELRCQITILP
jgi:hypothetical protein